MKFEVKVTANGIIRTSEIIYCDPTKERLDDVVKNILKEAIKIKA
jgi:hypothetical protein